MEPITLAVIPSVTPGDQRAALDALCAELRLMLGRRVIGACLDSYAALTSELEKDRVQFAWMPPVLMVLTDEQIPLRPLLCAVRDDRTVYSSVLFVDADKPYQQIEDLRGKTVAWVDTTSAAGYIYPRLHLAAYGVDPNKLFGHELFLGSHPEVVRAVFDGRADLGATYAEMPVEGQPVRRAGFCDVAPDRQGRVLEWTRPIPNDLLVAHSSVPAAEYRAFSRAILALGKREEGRKLLFGAFHAERFSSNLRDSLSSLWSLVELARRNGLLSHL
jgi:phosphonate transport system substrate-binding protein